MTTFWALVVIAASRFGEVKYVELYETKAQCELKVGKPGMLEVQRMFCVPAVQGEKK
jgi:hypothetical protein